MPWGKAIFLVFIDFQVPIDNALSSGKLNDISQWHTLLQQWIQGLNIDHHICHVSWLDQMIPEQSSNPLKSCKPWWSCSIALHIWACFPTRDCPTLTPTTANNCFSTFSPLKKALQTPGIGRGGNQCIIASIRLDGLLLNYFSVSNHFHSTGLDCVAH